MLSGILNVWQHEPADVARRPRAAAAGLPGRFVLGIGIGHPEATSDYTRPLKTMREFFDGLDAAAEPVPREERLAAALGPKMLDLSAERSLGTHPYFVTVEHTRFARERVGAGVLVAPEVAVVVEEDAETARGLAREYAQNYLRLSNYTNNLLRFGFTEQDIADAGSDRLIDAVIPHGPRRGDRGGRAPASRGRRRPRLRAAARARPGAGRGLPRPGPRAALRRAQPHVHGHARGARRRAQGEEVAQRAAGEAVRAAQRLHRRVRAGAERDRRVAARTGQRAGAEAGRALAVAVLGGLGAIQ